MPAAVMAGIVIVGELARLPRRRTDETRFHRLREAEVEHLHCAVGARP